MNKKVIQKSILTIVLVIFAILLYNNPVNATEELGKVTGEKVTILTDAGVKVPYLTWNAVPGATKYEIYKGTSSPTWLMETVTTNSFSGGEDHLLYSDEHYWIRALNANGEDGEFSEEFDYFVKPSVPTNFKVTKNGDTVKFTWNKVKGAIGYYIYVYTRTPGTNEITYYQYYSTISTSYTASYGQIDSNQMYAVTAVTEYPTPYYWDSEQIESDISSYATYRSNVGKPTGVKVTAQNGKAVLSWNKVSDADGYQIYNGNTYVGTTTSTSYKIYNLSSSKVHTLKIRAYTNNDFHKTKFYGNFAYINVFPNTISNVKTSLSGKTDIKITWSKKSNVTGYKIYRSTSKNSGYKQIKNITSKNTNSYKDKKLSKAKTYYYRVVPYLKVNGKEYNGGNSNTSSVKTFTDAKISNVQLKTEAGSTIAYVSWTKSLGNIDGYEICRATSKNGKYKKVKTVSSGSSSYKDKKLSKAKKYYYKIRGYKKINGKKNYTKYSNVKGIRTSYIERATALPHNTQDSYGNKATIKSVSMKYKKNKGSKAIYQVKMKLKIDSTYAHNVYFTMYFYDKNYKYVGYTTLPFYMKDDYYTKTFTWNNVEAPKKAVYYMIR